MSPITEDDEGDMFQTIATKKLKWGQVLHRDTAGIRTGHLAFGTQEQNVAEAVDGEFYSGV
jgi:hypothetical protein